MRWESRMARKSILAIAALLATAVMSGPVRAQPEDVPPPENTNACLQSGGQWTVTATVKSADELMGYYTIVFDSLAVGTPVVAVQLAADCLIGWAAGEDLPDACVAGSSVTVTGPLSVSEGVPGVQVREIECAASPADPKMPDSKPA